MGSSHLDTVSYLDNEKRGACALTRAGTGAVSITTLSCSQHYNPIVQSASQPYHPNLQRPNRYDNDRIQYIVSVVRCFVLPIPIYIPIFWYRFHPRKAMIGSHVTECASTANGPRPHDQARRHEVAARLRTRQRHAARDRQGQLLAPPNRTGGPERGMAAAVVTRFSGPYFIQ